jgi:hypothetical protein
MTGDRPFDVLTDCFSGSRSRDHSLSFERSSKIVSLILLFFIVPRLFAMFGYKRDHSFSIERSMAMVLSIVLYGLADGSQCLATKRTACSRSKDYWRHSPRLFSPTILNIRQRKRSLTLDREINSDRLLDRF